MDFVENRLDFRTATIRGRALIANDDGALTPGLFAKVRLPGSGRYSAVLVPDFSIQTDQSDKFVFGVESDQTIKRKVVRLVAFSHGLRTVGEGLVVDDCVVARGGQKIQSGVKVKVTKEQPVEIDDGLPDEHEPVPEDQLLRTPRSRPANVDQAPVQSESEVREDESSGNSGIDRLGCNKCSADRRVFQTARRRGTKPI